MRANEIVKHDFIDNNGRHRVFTEESVDKQSHITRRYVHGVIENERTFSNYPEKLKCVKVQDVWYNNGVVVKDITTEYTISEFFDYAKSKHP